MAFYSGKFVATSATDLMDQVGAALVSMGWSLHDNISSTNKVYSSNGESGDRVTEYIWMNVSGALVLMCAYGWWNNSTHAGNCQSAYAITENYSNIRYDAGETWYITGNKNLVYLTTGSSTNTKTTMFGHLKPFWNKPYGILQNAETAGSSVVVELDNVEGFVSGKYYQLFGAAGEGRYRQKISAIDTVNKTVTLETLSANMSAGSAFGACASTFVCKYRYPYQVSQTCEYNASGTGASASGSVMGAASALYADTYADPDLRQGSGSGVAGLYALRPFIFLENASNANAPFGYCDELMLAAPFNTQSFYGVGQQDSGTATAGGSNTLTCAGKSWTVDALIDKVVVIAEGTGVNQVRKITDNDATSITVASNWTTQPSTDSVFYICDEMYRVTNVNFLPYIAHKVLDVG